MKGPPVNGATVTEIRLGEEAEAEPEDEAAPVNKAWLGVVVTDPLGLEGSFAAADALDDGAAAPELWFSLSVMVARDREFTHTATVKVAHTL